MSCWALWRCGGLTRVEWWSPLGSWLEINNPGESLGDGGQYNGSAGPGELNVWHENNVSTPLASQAVFTINENLMLWSPASHCFVSFSSQVLAGLSLHISLYKSCRLGQANQFARHLPVLSVLRYRASQLSLNSFLRDDYYCRYCSHSWDNMRFQTKGRKIPNIFSLFRFDGSRNIFNNYILLKFGTVFYHNKANQLSNWKCTIQMCF